LDDQPQWRVRVYGPRAKHPSICHQLNQTLSGWERLDRVAALRTMLLEVEPAARDGRIRRTGHGEQEKESARGKAAGGTRDVHAAT
jgi:hypothetical protein